MYRFLYIVFVVFVTCWLGAQSTSLTDPMEDGKPVDVTVASILACLQDASLRDEPAEKLYKLAQALESKPSRERQGVLRQLCSKAEWDINLRVDGRKKTNAVVEQELRTAATRAYVALRSRKTALPQGAGVEGSAQPSGTEETHATESPRCTGVSRGAFAHSR